MHDPTSVSSSHDLQPRGARRIVVWLAAAAGLAALGAGAFIVIRLATATPGGAACEHFDALVAKDPNGAEIVRHVERAVESSVVRYGAVGTERVKISGCRDALATLDKALPHGQFTRVTDCIESARTARSAARCF